MLVFRKRNPKRDIDGSVFVPSYEFRKGKFVWVGDPKDPTAPRRLYVCTGNGTELVTLDEFKILMAEERVAARRRGGFYSRTAEFARNGLGEPTKSMAEVSPLPETAMGATA